jgi:RNA polymerase sigma factor (sigma-70 family)
VTGDPDLELYEAWCAGDQRAGARLFEHHYAAVARYFANKVRRDHDDLTQQTFLACVRSRDRFRRASSFRTFLFGIARNVLHRRLRDHARHDARIDFGTVSMAELAPGPSTIVTRRREQALVLEALRRVPLHFQEVLELQFWEELSGPAIAEVVGISEANVRNRLRRGKLALEREIVRLCEDQELRRRLVADLEGCARAIRPLEP